MCNEERKTTHTVTSGEINIISDLCLLVGHSYKLLYFFFGRGLSCVSVYENIKTNLLVIRYLLAVNISLFCFTRTCHSNIIRFFKVYPTVILSSMHLLFCNVSVPWLAFAPIISLFLKGYRNLAF